MNNKRWYKTLRGWINLKKEEGILYSFLVILNKKKFGQIIQIKYKIILKLLTKERLRVVKPKTQIE